MNHDDAAGLAVAERLRADIQKLGKRQLGVDPREVLDFPAFSVGAALLKRGDLEGTAEIAANLLARYPGHPEAAYLVGLCHTWGSRDWVEAVKMFRHVVEHRPAVAEYWYNLGYACQRGGQDEWADAAFMQCLDLDPTFAGALVNLGNLRLAQGRAEEAMDLFTRGSASKTLDPLARYNRSIARFFLGQWTEGWEDFECRWAIPEFRAKAVRPPLPFWDGTPPAEGQRLLVFAEQGLGDTLMCWRYAPALERMWGGRVQWVVQPDLAPLLVRSLPLRGEWPEADVCLPAMSCMHRLGMPADGGAYLPRTFERSEEDAPLRVGYVWAGSTDHENDARRSTERAWWDDLLTTPGVEFVELQVGRGGSYQPKDWVETADLVNSLDLVITVDTSLAHLAGAMGTPVWILLPSWCDYRWSLGSDRTLWYNSARLFRQEGDGDWPGVLERVRVALTEWRNP